MMMQRGESSVQHINLQGIFPSEKDQAITKWETNDLEDKSIWSEMKFNNMSCNDQQQQQVL